MTDLEIVKKCAEAMGHDVSVDIRGNVFFKTDGTKKTYRTDYNPLHDDTLAMALVKRFRLQIETFEVGQWSVFTHELAMTQGQMYSADGYDLNRAICECVAKMEIK